MYFKAKTFENSIKFKEELHNDYNFYTILEKQIIKTFNSSNNISYFDLLRKTHGVFPVELINSLNAKFMTKIDFNSEKNPIYNHVNNSQSVLKLPPAHMANYDWRYSKQSTRKIISYLEKSTSICCLGTPSVALELMSKPFINATLLDINKPIIEQIQSLQNGLIDAYCYNVLNNIPECYQSKFDVVIMDPPWYLDYYKLFIYRAIQLLNNKSGSIIMPIFPLLSHKSACNDIIELYEYLLDIGFVSVKSLGYIEYDMPDFEKKIILSNMIPIPNRHWRNAELIKISFINTENVLNKMYPISINDFVQWERKYFVKNDKYLVFNPFYLFPDGKKYEFESDMIKSISRKSINNRKIISWDNSNNIIIKK